MKIRIGHLSTFYHTAILLMAQGDAEARLGAEIEWKLLGTGPAIMKAFEQGELDLAYIGLPPAIIGMDKGINVICVAGGHVEGTVMSGKAKWTASSGSGDLGTVLGQFRGQMIGVPGTGSIHDVILKNCLEQYGLSREVWIRNFPWADLVLEAVVKDEVAAAFGTPALAVAVKSYASGKILISPQELWPNNPSYGIVAEMGFLRREEETVKRFLVLHEEATALVRQEPAQAARKIAGFVSVVDEEFVLDTLRVSPKYCAKLTADYIESTMKFVPVLKKLGYIRSDIGQDRIFSTALIDRMHPEKDHYGDGLEMSGKER
jgi:NitT/TauT family transport system substrate-binding protein